MKFSPDYVLNLGKRAKVAAPVFGSLSTAKRNEILLRIADGLTDRTPEIIAANKVDMEVAQADGMRPALLDRLMLNEKRIADIADSVRQLVALPDPVGKVEEGGTRPNGLRIYKLKVPLGIIGMIYEARPNVTVDAAALCVKSGNVCILRGGREAMNTNQVLIAVMCAALEECGVTREAIQLIEDPSRDSASALMRLNGYLDLLIPRGGAGLIKAVVADATVPVIETGAGNCHIYVDSSADMEMAVRITDNAKTSRPSVCNAAETLLVHREVAGKFLPMVKAALDRHSVELRCCPESMAVLGDGVRPAEEADWDTEYDDYIMAVKVVDSLEQAIDHINRHSTHHSDAIVTESYSAAQRFLEQVDSAAVYVNASTRFTDGGEFGYGAELGISTQKLHARGPMGLAQLTTVKYVIYGDGQIRA